MAILVPFAEYFAKPDAERILLLEITRNDGVGTTYYLSDAPYATEPSDTPSSIVFSPIIGAPGLPELKRTLSDPFDGVAATSFGTVTLVDALAAFNFDTGVLAVDGAGTLLDVDGTGTALDLGSGSGLSEMVLKRGAGVVVKIAGPRRLYAYTDALVLFKGTIARLGGDTDGNVTVEITDSSERIKAAVVPVGTAAPLTFGRCRNVTPFVVDPNTLTYAVHDGQINAILDVYDQGEALDRVSGYTVDLTTGQFALTAQPEGQVTVDVEGAVVNEKWLSSTADIIAELIRRAGVTLTQSYLLDDGIIGLFLNQSVTLGDQMTSLCRGAAGYWLINALGEFEAAPFPMPGTRGPTYDESVILAADSPVTFIDDDRLHKSIAYSYRKNWSQLQAREGATADQAAFCNVQFLTGSADVAFPDSEYLYTDSDQLETFFDGEPSAQNAANHLLKIFNVPRQILSQVPLVYSTLRSLGDAITIYFNAKAYPGVILGLGDVFDGGYPLQHVDVLS